MRYEEKILGALLDSYENSLVGNAVSGILLFADSDRF